MGRLEIDPTPSGRPVPPRGMSTPARKESWLRVSWDLRRARVWTWPPNLFFTLNTPRFNLFFTNKMNSILMITILLEIWEEFLVGNG